MKNPLLTESALPYGAPPFDKIRNEHYKPAFGQALAEAKAEIDRIVSNPEAPTFENTVEALENAGQTLDRVSGIFYNLLEADTDDELQQIAEDLSPQMTEYEMYVSLNEPLFLRIKAVWEQRDTLGLAGDQYKLLDDTYREFKRSGALLSPADKERYSRYEEMLSLLELEYGKHVLAATNAYTLHLKDEAQLAGLPDFVRESAAEAARGKGLEGWVFDLTYPSYAPFMKYSTDRELKRQLYMAYNTKAVGGTNDNLEIVRKIVDLRARIARILGYETYADYATEERMAKNPATVNQLIDKLLTPSLPAAKKEVADILAYARDNGFEDTVLQPWDFSYWSERYKEARFALNDALLKPYFRLEDCIDAAFGLAGRLYGLRFEERDDIPGYHKDVKVYDVKDADGKHLALFYADFFPRESKRGGAWMTEFRGQSIVGGVERRPFISLVTNFTKPTAQNPSLLTHDELTTLLHEFGHSLHGMLAQGRYESQTGTNVARDFVELPSQIMENWAYEPEFLHGFARHYRTGEPLPDELITRVEAAKNFLAAYSQVRQLQFGILDMAWHSLDALPEEDTRRFEKSVLAPTAVMPDVPECCLSASFNHIFSGGYSAGYYSYKWAEVLEADAFSLFQEKGIFNHEVAESFRDNILSKGSTEDEAVLYRRFRGHDPQSEALLHKLGIIENRPQ
ncbi:MAG: M3 family metallopeptidase [Bacteroidales bacterium]|nr:M3 family metallopeptidase [Bacteroidales bacterium]